MASSEKDKAKELLDNLRFDKYPLPEERQKSIGSRTVRRLDGVEKASGYANYTMDVQLPGMLYARFLTSPYPHAAIKSMDCSKAEALPGVRAILRYDDPEIQVKEDLGGHGVSPKLPLPGVAHFQGEEIGAFVAADSEEIADEALRLIKIEWDVRPFVLTVEDAMKDGAPLVNPEEFPESNIEAVHEAGRGNVEQGFKESDVVFEFTSRKLLHTYISPERPCGVWRWNGEYPEVWCKQQRPHIVKRAIASWFGGIPHNRIELHILYQGASFGGWSQYGWNQGGNYCAAVLSRRTGRPIKWSFTRREDFYGGSMDEGIYHYKVGAKKDGTIMAVSGEAIYANPAWGGQGPVLHLEECTKIPNLYGKRTLVFVNKGPNTAVRCEQLPNTHTLTLIHDHVASELGLDPMEVALKNDGVHGHDMAEWGRKAKLDLGFPETDSLRECIKAGKKSIDWEKKSHAPGTKKLPNGRMHGIGFTWNHEWEDSASSSEIAMRLERNDGTLRILAMRCDNGVNAETSYCQVAADELGMKIEDVFFRPQTDVGFFTGTPDSSTNMSVNGFAVRHAARMLREKILKAAVSPRAVTQRGSYPPFFPDCKPEDLDIKDSVIFLKKDPSKKLTLAEFVGPSGDQGAFAFYELYGTERTPFTEPMFTHSYHVQVGAYKGGVRPRFIRQCHFMEVEVDTETGEIIVTKVVNVNDVGKAINPMACEGQMYGGTYMGVGRALWEEMIHDPATGVLLNGNLLDYKIATIEDCGPIDTVLKESRLGFGPYGLVGIGENTPTMIPALLGPAVFNAIGVWIDDYPITPDKVLKALGKR
ncbi:MAG: xanthine dehydrogenase [Deltaproteobacteria bacterium HGW-Deltaproteobacteria-12]|jgi:CO/xanthine dehydrogenase Mo-binding subunit|nr:MAG: xanthine dehydrogenase [Deltaproteobacteria bacterium HGW-Deltaproteobacteria-12]